ncbi:MAG: ABC transporter ATP-binding protein [Ruminiclostridium sp.]|nr:ABC transporter ATP-binding protein [Ruminiclostridium sp.]
MNRCNVLKWIGKIFSYYPFNVTAFSLLRILGFAGLGILPGIIIRTFFDRLSKDTLTHSDLLFFTALLVAIPIAQAVSYYADLALSYGWVEIIRSIFRRNIFSHIIKQPGAMELPVSHGQLINNLRDDINTPITLVWDIPYFLAYTTFSIIGLIIMSASNWVVTLVLFSPLVAIILLVNWMKRKIEIFFQAQQKATDKVLHTLSDIFNYVQAIKINNMEGNFVNRLKNLNDDRTKAYIKNDILNTLLNSVYDNIINIGTGILLLVISPKLKNGILTVGDFSLFIYFLGYTSNLTRLLGNSLASLKRSGVSLQRIDNILGDNSFEILTEKGSLYLKEVLPQICYPPKSGLDRLEKLLVDKLTYIYPGSNKGIRDISFSLSRGSFTVITGKIGSGKTTLLRVLLGLLPKESGDIYWNNILVNNPQSSFIPPTASYIPQIPHLFSESLKNNILLGLPDDRLNEALELAEFKDDIVHLENKLDTVVGPKGVKLSGGQIQRAAASRMFIRDSQIWLFDDISSALDVKTERKLWENVYNYAHRMNITCLVVTHKKFALQYANHIIVLDNGEVKCQGSLDYLLNTIKNKEITNILY